MDDAVTKLHAFNDIRSFISTETQNKLIDELNIRDRLEQRLSGLIVEHEFALIAFFSEQCEHIVGFEESFSKLTDSKTPDFFIKMKSGEKYLIEVKSKVDDTLVFHGITKTNLAKKKALADDLNAKWCVAIKMGGRWGIFDYDTFTKKDLKISYPLDLNDSIFMKMFNFEYYIVTKNVYAESSFSKQKKDNDEFSITDKEYGYLTNYSLKTSNGINLIESSNKAQSIFVECLHNCFKKSVSSINENTKIIETLEAPQIFSTDQCMIATALHTLNELGIRNDSKTFFTDLINSQDKFNPVEAYKKFWNNLASKCTNNEIISTPQIKFLEDGKIEVIYHE